MADDAAREPRIAPLPQEEWDDETAALLGAIGPLNLFTTLAHHPKLLKRWLVFGGHVLSKSTLTARERELAILRVGWRCDSDYEFGQHTLIGREVGLSDDEILGTTRDDLTGWSTIDAALLAATDQLVAEQRIGDDTWAELSAHWSTEQLMDLVFTVGQYVMVCMALRTFGVVRDDGVPAFPEGDSPEGEGPEGDSPEGEGPEHDAPEGVGPEHDSPRGGDA